MNVTVVSTVTGCDVTTVQLHYKGSTSIFRYFCFCNISFEFVELCFVCVSINTSVIVVCLCLCVLVRKESTLCASVRVFNVQAQRK